MILMRPRRVVEDVLVPYEVEQYEDAPSIRGFLADRVPEFATIALLLLVMARSGSARVGWIGLAMIVAILVWLVARMYAISHTRYVLTNYRAIRVSGLFRRDVEWMTWSKVTDVQIRRSWLDRVLGTATVKIMSANESSGFKAMSDLTHPYEFVSWVTDLVNAKQGPVNLPG